MALRCMMLVVLSTAPRSTARGAGCTSAAIRCSPPSSPSRPSSCSCAWLFAEARAPARHAGSCRSRSVSMSRFAGLLVLQPDVGQTLLVSLVWCALFFLAGRPLRVVSGASARARLAGLAAAYYEFRLRALAHRPLSRSRLGRELPDGPRDPILRRGRLLRPRPRRGHHQDRAAGRPHRFHLRRGRRGVRRAGLPGAARRCSPSLSVAGLRRASRSRRDAFTQARRRRAWRCCSACRRRSTWRSTSGWCPPRA